LNDIMTFFFHNIQMWKTGKDELFPSKIILMRKNILNI
jgi:hypothetical protein